MPNDPKWRTIARASGQPISLVLSVYVHLLVDASRNVTRGHVDVTIEDLASALDVTDEQINSIFLAMDGRVKSGTALTGWKNRQVVKEDVGNGKTGAKSAAERKAEQRERDKEADKGDKESEGVTLCHEVSRNVTTEERREEEIIKEANASLSGSTNSASSGQSKPAVPACPFERLIDSYEQHLPSMPRVRRMLFKDGKNAKALRQRWAWVMTSRRDSGERKGERLATTDDEGVAWFDTYFQFVAGSKFLTESFSSCDLSWLIARDNFEKVLSGRYEEREGVAA